MHERPADCLFWFSVADNGRWVDSGLGPRGGMNTENKAYGSADDSERS